MEGNVANIKLKDIKQLELWNDKELRKLRMVIKNRISYLENPKDKGELPTNHPLFNKQLGECKEILQKVISVEQKKSKT